MHGVFITRARAVHYTPSRKTGSSECATARRDTPLEKKRQREKESFRTVAYVQVCVRTYINTAIICTKYVRFVTADGESVARALNFSTRRGRIREGDCAVL